MADNKTSHTDEGLQDNEQIEQAILALQQQPSQEMLAHALTRTPQTDACSRTADRCSRTTGWRQPDAPSGDPDR